MDFVNSWTEKTGFPARFYIHALSISKSKFFEWRKRYGKVNEHNGLVPRDFWLEAWEKMAIVEYYQRHPNEGYRRLTFMMLDEGQGEIS